MARQMVSLTGRMLGALLYYAPDNDNNMPLFAQLRQSGWHQTWPCGDAAPVEQAAQQMTLGLQSGYEERLADVWQRLFIGPDHLEAPPWGSVYLDKESVLFGDSTLALRLWLRQQGIEPCNEAREPEDHIGLMLMLAAWCAEHQPDGVPILLADHLLPWAMRYLDLLEQAAGHPFYQGVAALTRTTLQDWQRVYRLTPAPRQLFY
ncbi:MULTISPECIES: Tat proofreading chaperone DmsD [Musicola]|uniref:Tat proofreading chaperone DmsD n=1 Tax=Musicola paradisiaca (strain Ech703) TaxID=579405 RepID=C6C7U5_MUSP7|nr:MULTISPECIES: Tat proofreading chaperone DmsD [Musicola]ACS86037.1 cytoplasmic chaperone TorD family protein [Musicola paradisiaca Ech703]